MQQLLLHNTFEQCAEQYPDKIAVSEKNRDTSYLLLNRQANYVAHLLAGIGAGKDDVVAYLGVSGIELTISVLGIFKAGSIYMPVDAALPDNCMKDMLQETGCRLLITTRAHRQLVLKWCREENLPLEYLLILTPDYLEAGLIKKENGEWHTVKLPSPKNTENPGNGIGLYDSCYQFYTHGSNDHASDLPGYHKELRRFVNWEIDAFQLDNNICAGHVTHIGEQASLRDMLVPLTIGGTLLIASEDIRRDTERLIDWIRKTRVQLLHLTTPVFYSIYREIVKKKTTQGDSIFPALRFVLLSGEPLTEKNIDDWNAIAGEQIEIIHLYETSVTTMVKTTELKENLITGISA